jgi:superfamily II DNA or RNA helicase
MKNIIKYKPGEQSWIRWIKKRIKHNLNFIALFQGATGIGKTWSAISLAQKIDPDFQVNQIVFDFKGLMEIINSEEFQKKKWKIIIFDEPQITISNRNWQSATNKLMNYLLTTFRHQNIILLFCSPYVDFLDSQSMKLLHCIFECSGVDKTRGLSRVKPKIQQYNSYLRKTYQHPLRVIVGNKQIPLREWYLSKPSPEIIELYEQKKTEFTSQLNRDIIATMNKLSAKEKGIDEAEKADNRKPLTDKQRRTMEVLANIKEGDKYARASEILGISFTSISQHKKLANKKGYRLEEFKNE